jgi:hypothetical protein
MKNSIEKIYGKVFEVGHMSLNTVIQNGTKTPSNEMRRDSYYYNTYESGKYSNLDKLDQLQINYNSYLALSYKGYDKNKKFFNKEIWMNNTSLENFKDFIEYSYDYISQNAKRIYGKNDINKEFEDFIIHTGYNDDGSGFGAIDSLGTISYVYPVMLSTEDNKNTYNGIMLGIETPKEEQYEQEMSLSTFYTFVMTIKNYNSQLDGRLVSIMGLLYQILNDESSANSYSGPSYSNKIPSRTVTKKPVIQRRQTLSEAMATVKKDEEAEEKEEIKEELPKRSTKKNVVKKTEKVSLNDILAEAENMEIDLDDEGEEY